jgi:cytidylate kinase
MSVITISRGSYSRGKEVAEKVAAALGYECISREILLEASEQFNIPEIKLVRAIHDAPSILERFTYGKERYVAYLKASLLKHIQKDNVVYHGLAGHFFLQDIPHVLKVRIIADLDDRVAEEMKRENISEAEARLIIRKDDDERRRWSLQVFGIDTWDPMLYDMVIHIKSITVDCAVNLILQAVKSECFRTTAPSQKIIDDQTLAARIQAALVEEFPTAKVSAREGEIFVDIKASLTEEQEVINKVKRIAAHVAGIEVKLQCFVHP